MTKDMTVVTACTGTRDTLRDDQVKGNARFVAFVDQIGKSDTWDQHSACGLFASSRRNSRIHKLLIHQYVDTPYSLWMDANMSILVSPEELIEAWLGDHDVAMFKHRRRTCLFEEGAICADLELDDPQTIGKQVAHYRSRGFPANAGLGEACVILRRHTKAVENFNNAWWSEYCRHSVRDQISLMFAARNAGVKINLIEPGKFDHPFFDATHRSPGLEPWAVAGSRETCGERESLLALC